MSDSRILTPSDFDVYLKCAEESGDIGDIAVRDHDSAQREEIDRIRERLKEALERLQKPSDTDDYNESWASRTFSEVFGQEGK